MYSRNLSDAFPFLLSQYFRMETLTLVVGRFPPLIRGQKKGQKLEIGVLKLGKLLAATVLGR